MAKRNAKKPGPRRVTAETLAAGQREISVSEFFAKNRHLLGFDNPRKALLTAVKEAVDNALDACEEAGILPDLLVELRPANGSGGASASGGGGGGGGDDRFLVIVQDNGPGIVRKQVENIFGKLLYGSKFHRLKMSRGQQGIGISAAGMYGLITTGKPVRIVTRTSKRKPAHEVLLKMDTSKNRADVIEDAERPEFDGLFDTGGPSSGTGTRVEIELVGKYLKGDRSVDQYVQLTAIANPHARIVYRSPPTGAMPEGEEVVHERSVGELPEQTEEIKPHPHGIELGTLIGMLERTGQTKLGGFFGGEFCRVGPSVCKKVCAEAGLTPNTWVKSVGHDEAERLYRALRAVKVMAPPTNCLSPIGVRTLLKGLESGLDPDFIAASSRAPTVYRGRPFVIEAGIAFGGALPGDEPAKVYRFANRVPLLYQQSACASFKSVLETSWKNYGLQQPRGALPVGPLVVMIHMASVWVPFTSESKEAIADDDEIRKEMRLALQECGRKLGSYLRRRQRMKRAGERRDVFRRYIGEVAKSCSNLTGEDAEALYAALLETARRKTAEMDQELDEEGRVVRKGAKRRPGDPLADDEGVYIRERPDGSGGSGGLGALAAPSSAAERHANALTDDDASGGAGANLFGEPEAAPAGRGAGGEKKTKRKVVRKKKVVKRGAAKRR